jgi:hypothetical protein
MILVMALLFSAWMVSLPGYVLAQSDESELKLSLSRDFGYSSGTGDIQGTFSMKATGPENLVKVEFMIDNQVVYEDTAAPFGLQFTTDAYALGMHTLSAVGYTQDEQVIASTHYKRNFVSASAGSKAAFSILIPLVVLVLGLSLVSYLLPALLRRGKSTPLGAQRNYGLAGGTICKKCKRPFAFNFFSLKLIFGRFDRCPHCGKWSLLQRYPIEMLRAAEAAELAGADEQAGQFNGQTDEQKLQKALDDSRFQDV